MVILGKVCIVALCGLVVFLKGLNMTSLKELVEMGKEMGLMGKELQDFITSEREAERQKIEFQEIKEKQRVEREERAKEREYKKWEMEEEHKKKLLEFEQEKLKSEMEQRKETLLLEQAHEKETLVLQLQKEKEQHDREREQREHEKEMIAKQIELETNKKTTGPSPSLIPKGVKLPHFQDGKDDFDAYIVRFERYAEARGWPKEQWATDLSTLLTGKALETYYRLSKEEATDYDKLKHALMKRYQLTEDGFRNKFYKSKAEVGETAVQFMARLDNYFQRWITLAGVDKTYEGLQDLILREQFVGACHRDLFMFIRERTPKSAGDVVALADLYLDAHGGSLSDGRKINSLSKASDIHGKTNEPSQDRPVHSKVGRGVKKCYKCGDTTHLSYECGKQQNYKGSQMSYSETRTGVKTHNQNFHQDRRCFLCDKKGHMASECRNFKGSVQKAMALAQQQVDSLAQQVFEKDKRHSPQNVWRIPSLNTRSSSDGQRGSANEEVSPVNISAACLSTVIVEGASPGSSSNIPVCSISTGQPVQLCNCGHMPVVQGKVNNNLVSTLRDSGCSGAVVRASLVTPDQFTGKMFRCLMVDGTSLNVPTAQVEVDTPYYVGVVEAMVMETPIYDLIIGNIPGARDPDDPDSDWSSDTGLAQAVITRAQAKDNKPSLSPLNVPDIADSDEDSFILQKEQEMDESLAKLWEKAKLKEPPKVTANGSSWFVIRKGLLYRIYKPFGSIGTKSVKQVIVPRQRRNIILRLAHESIMSGHMAIKRTLERVLSNFFWPDVHGDVTRFCQSCDICQRTVPKGRAGRVPLEQMPIIDVPFRRIAVDLVGPIHPMTKRKNRYILTLVDVATRYPEAVPLPSIDTVRVAEALLEVYSRMGFPHEVLSDLGTQFTSELMREVNRLVSVKQLTTTPYHPICNGLVERWNATLKQILKRLCSEEPAEWDRYLPAVLFAYRSATQESLGFSPFELLFGRTVRGPMEILRTLWTKQCDSPEVKSCYKYVTDLKQRLQNTCKIAHEELSKAQVRYKKQYDRKSRVKELQPGDQALLLLPTDHNKLLMQWKGPFSVVGKTSPCNYILHINGKEKLFHINMLKPYIRREKIMPDICAAASLSLLEMNPPLEEEDGVVLEFSNLGGEETYKDVVLCDTLTSNQRGDVLEVVKEYQDIFTDNPGTTHLAEHHILVTSDDPVHSKPYPVPYAMRGLIEDEITKMLKAKIIEPSESPYASPVVLVPKADGSRRFCIDYRKLNKVTIFDSEPMPCADDIFAKLQGDLYFTKIDLSKGYWQIPMSKESKPKTSFVTWKGSYQFCKMPFGLVNATATFNRMMRKLLFGMSGIDSYVDDILIHTSTWDDHMLVLCEILRRLRRAQLTVRPTKCQIGWQSLEFVGHVVGKGCIQPHPNKVSEILDAPRPITKKQVRSFLGLIGYYRKYIPNFATLAVPLTDLTRKGNSSIVKWGVEQDRSFETLKQALTEKPILRVPDHNRPFMVMTDASDHGIGAVLLQEYDDVRFPIAYASKKLLPAQRAYSTIEKEGLAIVWAISKFRTYLYGKTFTLLTDHRPLTYIDECKSANGRILRWSLFLQNYRFHIQSVKGADNVVADYLSRQYHNPQSEHLVTKL